MEVNVVLTGLVRDHSRLLNKLAQFENWQQRGYVNQVIFSTWLGEIDKYGGLRQRLQELGVLIIESEEPKLILKGGHQLHQMLNLHYGLAAVTNTNSYVLKTRVDLADNIEDMLWDFERGTSDADDFLGVGLEGKILVEYSQLLFPFLMGDAQFFGRLQDLKKLINFSNEMEILYSRLAVEQTFFFSPFRETALFQHHFYWNLPHISDQQIQRVQQIDFIVKSTYFQQLILSWCLVMSSYFKVGWGQEGLVSGPMSLSEIVGPDSPLQIGPDGSFLLQKSHQIGSLLSSLSSAQIEALRTSLLVRNANPFFLDGSFFKEMEEFRRNFSTLTKPRAGVMTSSNTWQIRGPVQHFFVAEDGDLVRMFQDQVTFLRRQNDALQRQLGTAPKATKLHLSLVKWVSPETLERLKLSFPRLFRAYQRFFWWK